jgi:hypothetical protein
MLELHPQPKGNFGDKENTIIRGKKITKHTPKSQLSVFAEISFSMLELHPQPKGNFGDKENTIIRGKKITKHTPKSQLSVFAEISFAILSY